MFKYTALRIFPDICPRTPTVANLESVQLEKNILMLCGFEDGGLVPFDANWCQDGKPAAAKTTAEDSQNRDSVPVCRLRGP